MRITRAIQTTILVALVSVAPVFATDLKITDSTNTIVTVREAYVDYGGFSGDKETEGIRVHQGDAVVTAKWTNIATLTITGRDPSTPQSRLKADLVLKSGAKVSVTLVTKGRMRLAGTTELGEYAIDLAKVQVISPAS
jgi:hypothetical protein